MKTILATWELGLANGHVAHVAPLARGMKRLGVATAFAARDVVTAALVGDRPFASIHQAPVLMRPVPRIPTLTYAQVIADGGFGDADHATALVAAWLMLFEAVKPAGIVTEFAPVSLLAAHVAGLPVARMGYGWAQPKAEWPLGFLMPWLPDDRAARTEAGRLADHVVQTVCARFGAPPLAGLPDLLALTPRFLTTWPDLDHGDIEPGMTYYGSMSGLAATLRPDWPAGQGPRAFVYMPFSHAAGQTLVAALAALGWPTIWHCAEAPPQLPGNIVFSLKPVDVAYVLGEAAIFIGRGGHATCCEAVRAGCPILIIPDSLETTLGGWRFEQRGLARLLTEAATTSQLRAALETLLDDFGESSAAAQRRYAGYDPTRAENQMAADIFKHLGL